MVGQTISHYKILAKIGEGGMGVVYKARDEHLDRLVAIKVLPPARVADPVRKKRFVQEAKAASALNHPNIVTIHDIDQADGIDFIAMEFIDGKPLDEVIPRKGLRLNETLKCSMQIADALATAHEAKIVHRDLKPGNVMVTQKGVIKVLDFGLAKMGYQAVRTDHWKYIHYVDLEGMDEICDLEADPYETKNLIHDQRAQPEFQKFRQELQRLPRSNGSLICQTVVCARTNRRGVTASNE